MDAVGNLLAPGHRVFVLREELVHVLRRPHVVRVRHVLFGIALLLRVALLLRADAEEHVVRLGIVGTQIVSIRRGHERHAELVRNLRRDRRTQVLQPDAVVLNLDVEVVLEQFREVPGELLGFVLLVREDVLIELAGEATAEADEPFRMGFENLAVDARVVVVPFEERDRGELDEVLEADGVLGEQREVRIGIALAGGFLIAAIAGREVGFVAEDGIEPALFAFLIELDGSVEVAVVGDGQGVHAELFGLLHELGDSVEPVEHGVVRVQVQVRELPVGHRRGHSWR